MCSANVLVGVRRPKRHDGDGHNTDGDNNNIKKKFTLVKGSSVRRKYVQNGNPSSHGRKAEK